MTGGLLQIVSQGSADLFLTGIPQITFFKIVYKKHTNFAVENIVIPLEGISNFDQKVTTNIPKTGDLIYKMYLQVSLPALRINNYSKYIDKNQLATLNTQLGLYNALIPKYNLFFKYNFIILNGLNLEINTINSTWYTANTLMTKYALEYGTSISAIGLNMNDVITQYNLQFKSPTPYVGSDAKTQQFIVDVSSFISGMTDYYKNQEKTLYQNINKINVGINNINTTFEYFSWTDRLGFNLINRCTISLGGVDVTSFDSDFLNVYYSLNGDFKQRKTLDTMIGSIPALTNYDNLYKPATTLYIPLPFWFSQHNGNALPMVSLVYHDVDYTVEFNSLDKCCFYNGDQNLNNLIKLGSCALYIDYVYMDVDERKKFAQFSHEYLVQTVQMNVSNINNVESLSIDMGFQHPVKEIYWIIKENSLASKYKLYNIYYPVQIYAIQNITLNEDLSVTISFVNDNDTSIPFANNSDIILRYSKYYDGKYRVINSGATYVTIDVTYLQYVDYNDGFYGIIYNNPDANYFSPINTEYIAFNGQNRTPEMDSKYFNYVVPYQFYKATPNDGINAYSFSLHPTEYQPSGSCNLSLIASQTLNINLNKKYYNYINKNGFNYELSIYAINYNVLRIHNGLATLVFST